MADNINKDVKYLNKDFSQYRKNLIDFAKNYFPNTYNDFNESSPGMMFIEMAAYVGDVLSYYTDAQMRESLIVHANEKQNIYSLAQSLGYRTKNTVASTVKLDVFQLIPSKGTGPNIKPDFTYALSIKEEMLVRSDLYGTEFRTVEPIDFGYSSSLSPTELTVYQINDMTQEPEWYLLKKSITAISGKIKTKNFTFNEPKIYDKIVIQDDGIIEIIDIFDDDNNRWYEVPYLAQDTIYESVRNIPLIDPQLSQYRELAPYLLKLKKTSKRFITRFKSDDSLEVQFGAGVSDGADEELIPNPDLVGLALPGRDRDIDLSIDPSNFLYTKTYGLAPADTTLTIRYTTGTGINDNVPANDLVNVVSVVFDIDEFNLDAQLMTQVKASLATTNPLPATGGKSKEADDEIKNNALANFASQNRAVSKEDYIIRAYSMHPRYGAIAKAYVTQDDQLSSIVPNERIPNPLALNLYVLGFDGDKKLTQLNEAVKENLKTYLSSYRLMTDGINVKDGYIINIGINFDIIVLPDYNSNEVVLKCISKLKELFDISKWQINQPILISKIGVELDKVDGVQTVSNIEIVNKYDIDMGYSGNVYDIKSATKDGIIYPSMDPSVFEVRYPNKDIQGRVVSY